MAAKQAMRSPEEAAPGDGARQEEHTKRAGDGAGETISAELKQAIREAALDVLGPVARQATMSAAKYAVGKAPELVNKHVLKGGDPGDLAQQVRSKGVEALSHAGGIGGVTGKLLSKLGGKGKGSAPSGWGRGRRMPVQQHVYVSVPVRDAYNGWTEYKQWSRYMHRVNQVDAQLDDEEARVKVTEKMWGFTRPFTAEVLTQRPDELIKWNSTAGPKHAGVINFHELGPRLTLIELNLDHSPSGPVEKVARGARFVKRAVRADFHRFQGWIEMKTDDELDALEGWRGTIEDGRIVVSHEDALEVDGHETQLQEAELEDEPGAGEELKPDAREEQEPEAGEEDEPEAGEVGEPEAGEVGEPEAGEEDEPEAGDEPKAKARPARARREHAPRPARGRR
jgi:uncharacterized membrane protein